jgi:hypothetical protein
MVDCVTDFGGKRIEINLISKTDNEIKYEFELVAQTKNIEVRIFNPSGAKKTIIIHKTKIQKIA